jgi:hypothetical protein
MTATAEPIPPRTIDAQSLRRLSLRTHTAGDRLIAMSNYLSEAVSHDRAGEVDLGEGMEVLDDAIADCIDALRLLMPLQRLAIHAYVNAAKWSAVSMTTSTQNGSE